MDEPTAVQLRAELQETPTSCLPSGAGVGIRRHTRPFQASAMATNLCEAVR